MANLSSILQLMKSRSVTEGWGALSVFNRTRLNRLLEQQYIQRFGDLSFLPAFMDTLQLDDQGEAVELQHIELGIPLLSFETASLISSTATITMNIVSGRVVTHQPLGVSRFPEVRRIFESDGHKLYMDIDLSMVIGEVDRRGKVTLDLSKAANFRCDLLGADPALQQQLGSRFKQYFDALPADRSVFVLGMLDVLGYNPLTPVSFRILTQAAPKAKDKAAANYGDGVVLVFIRLRGNTGDGQLPQEGDFPYLMPDDRELDGSDSYSALLVLSHDMLGHVTDGRLDLLNRLLFPGAHVFQESQQSTPYDLAVFGNIDPTQTSLTLSPVYSTIKAGQTQQFTLHDGNGAVITASAWKALGLENHESEREGSIVNGLYTAPSQELIGRESMRVVVTAEFKEAGITYTASALLFVVFEGVAVSPRTALQTAKTPELVTLSASSTTAVTWKTLEPVYGDLKVTGANGALFTPDSHAANKSLAVQQIEVAGADNTSVQSSLLMVNAQQLLEISPPFEAAPGSAATVQLSDDPDLLPDVPRRWTVISGEGTVDNNGRFTAPTQRHTSTSVVQCNMVRNGIIFGSGYSVIELSDLELEPVWTDLSKFEIRVPGFGDGRVGTLYSNGYQQLQIEVSIETRLPDGTNGKLSVTEIQSLKLGDNGGQLLPFVSGQGIPEDDTHYWQVNRAENSFELSKPGKSKTRHSPSADIADLIAPQELFLHSRGTTSGTFYAMFTQDSVGGVGGRPYYSYDYGERGTIDVNPVLFSPVDTNYSFVRERTDGGGGGSGPEEDDFDFHLVTEDYWKLSYVGSDFLTAEFVSVDGREINTSSIRWESEYHTEEMFSWTGYIFDNTLLESASINKNVVFDKSHVFSVPENVIFDIALEKMLEPTKLNTPVKKGSYASGKMIFVLRRTDDLLYIQPGFSFREKLIGDMGILLRDRQGNAHWRRVGFLPASVEGDRNRLTHNKLEPPAK